MPTLGTRVSQRDCQRLVGRDSQLAAFEELFVDDPRASVVFLHGPGGIGKSTLVRELARRGERRGWTTTFVEGRELAPVPDALELALQEARKQARPLLLIDSYERMTALGGFLRDQLLRSFPARTLVVIAGRAAPERSWFEAGWESVVLDVELGPLSEQEARDLLRARGVVEPRIAAEFVAWAGGSPLALALGADTVGQSQGGWSPHNAIERHRMVQSLIRRLVWVFCLEVTPDRGPSYMVEHREIVSAAAMRAIPTERAWPAESTLRTLAGSRLATGPFFSGLRPGRD